ncbi:type II secretion system protein [Endozoicomonas sp. G2_2]|uniref:type II secretion system protein n=1 Tax=Endozoicomonas sp. G2_2 TaxID=2821092 RepID=UPI001ADCB264|nr:type II secretion system protein [Endozoicomonas sp. G2_2]MBO9471090.1 type II secretion system protein [Endozoicomonas sp. G2_2]
MSTRTHSHTSVRRMRGFTMIELMVAIAVASLLAALTIQTVTSGSNQTRAQEAQRFLIEDLPAAMIDLARSSSSSTRLNNASQLEQYGVALVTPWGSAWSVRNNAVVNGAHTIRYPIGGSDADVRGQALAAYLKGDTEAGSARFSFIQSASYSNGNLTVTYSPLL